MAKYNFSYKAPKVEADKPVKLTVNTLYGGNQITSKYATINIIKSISLKSLMTFVIDENVAATDTAGCITCLDDAAGTTDNDILEWAGLKPVILHDGGIEGQELNCNDLSKYQDGTEAPITKVGNDVMCKMPIRPYKISKEDSKVTIQITGDITDKEGFVSYPWLNRNNVLKDAFYMGIYEAYVKNSKLYSVSGVNPTSNVQWQVFNNYATARGVGYKVMGWYQWLYYQILYIAIVRDLNSQKAVGKGKTGLSGDPYKGLKTGTMNTKGVTWGDQTGTNSVKFGHIENPWGSLWIGIDDIYMDKTGKIYTRRGGQYENTFTTTHTGSGFFSFIQGTNDGGFFPANNTDGSDSKYYTDYHWYSRSYDQTICYTGGDWAHGSNAGAFYLHVGHPVSFSAVSYGSRLVYV